MPEFRVTREMLDAAEALPLDFENGSYWKATDYDFDTETYTFEFIEKPPQEHKMQLFNYAVVRTNKSGKYREILENGTVLARDENAARTKAVLYLDLDELDLDRLEVVVRPF